MRIDYTYSNFISIALAKRLKIQYIQHDISYNRRDYTLFSTDGLIEYFTSANGDDSVDFEIKYKASCNKNIETVNSDGIHTVSPSLDDTLGLYPKKRMYRYDIVPGSINIFDDIVTNEKRINGGECWVDNASAIHDDDIVEFSVVDKDNILGLFPIYGLTPGVDVLELCKFVQNDFIKKGNAADGFYSQYFQGIKGTNRVYMGLYFRTYVFSFGLVPYRLLARYYFYE